MRGEGIRLDQPPQPPIPSGVDLHDFSFTPIFRTQLFRSAFHARATDAEWRAGVTLWLKSWDQIPAGSLPDDDIELCRLAEFGRDQRTWKKLRPMALHGWYICADGRLYHRVVAEGVLAAYARRRAASDKGKIGASRRWAVIDGGLSNASANGSANGSAMQQPLAMPMPGDSNRQGEGYKSPLPPLEKGASRQRRSPERVAADEAKSKWTALLRSNGKNRDSRVEAAIKAVGGWPRIKQRTEREEPVLMREFCDAYLEAPPT